MESIEFFVQQQCEKIDENSQNMTINHRNPIYKGILNIMKWQ